MLIAIPLCREEFADDEARGTDFVRAYAAKARPFGLPAWAAYERFAERCRTLSDDAERTFGVTVTRRARAQNFLDALDSHDTVTLVAHARGPEITEADIVDVEAVRAAAVAMMQRHGEAEALPSSAEELARYLDWALGDDDVTDEDASTLTETQLFARRTGLYRERAERRRLLEGVTDGALGGGPGVEFHDGIVSNEGLSCRIVHVPTLDLTVCDSVLLAECIRRHRSEGVILSNPRPTAPDFRLALYREAVRSSLRSGMSFPNAVIHIRRQLKGPRP